MANDVVFGCDDLRRYILSFLRKHPKISCAGCGCVCVWDKKKLLEFVQVNPFLSSDNKYYCINCLGEYYSTINMGCGIT